MADSTSQEDTKDVPSEQSQSAAAAAVPSSPADSTVDPALRILRKGDLVRVADRKATKVRNRDGGLGRIHRSIPCEGDHPFRYDVDFVLGGRIVNVERSELVYTTADAEGLTEDASSMRARRKRNPSAIVKEAEAVVAPKKKKVASKKGATKKAASKKVVKKGKATAGVKRKAKEVTKKAATKRKKEEVEAKEEDSSALDLYDRHRREFERCLARLERQDPYGYFVGDPPPEHDEHYESNDNVLETSTDTNSAVPAADPAGGQASTEDTTQAPPGSQGQASQSAAPVTTSPVFPDTPPFNFHVIRKRMERGRYVLDRVRERKEQMIVVEQDSQGGETDKSTNASSQLVHPIGVHWNQFRDDMVAMCDAAIKRDPSGVDGGPGTLGHSASKLKTVLEQTYMKTGRRQMREMEHSESRHKFANILQSIENKEAAMQGRWRTTPFPERKYERLSSDVVCAGLSELDERTAINELQTSLPDSFVGLSYTYNDTGQSESWMKSVVDGTGTASSRSSKSNKSSDIEEERKAALELAADDGVVRAQVQATMTTLLIGVQDRVMTDTGVLSNPELKSANWEEATDDEQNSESPDLVEQPVWGIDCYTRRNITTCIEKDFDSDIALEFIEKWLLPAINACPVDLANNMANAARILEGLSPSFKSSNEEDDTDDGGDERWSHSLLGKALKDKMRASGPSWLKLAAHELREAINTLGHDFFRVHPKGHGSIVLRPNLKPNTLVTFYRGEVYPSWRWGEKMDAIEKTQTRLGARPQLPDFYNMALERPQVDPRGYGLLFVDASRKAGHGSSLSHSCDPTCEVRVAAVGGKLCLAMATLREVELGEELTFDYNAVTESLNEYRSAVCLCGHGRCRGSFLHFATADCYQQVLNRNCPVAVRLSNIIKGCTKQVMSEADDKILADHGFGTAAFGAVSFRHNVDSMNNVPVWLRTYVADTLRYIEYERRALPIALLCDHLNLADGNTKSSSLSNDASSQKSSKSANSGSKAEDRKQKKNGKKNPSKKTKVAPEGQKNAEGKMEKGRPIPGSKPEPVFFFFLRKNTDFFRSQLNEQGLCDLEGIELKRAIQKVAGCSWRALGDDKKEYWKKEAFAEWEKSGGREKARLEAERLRSVNAKLALEPPGSERKRENDSSSSDKKSKKRKVDSEKEENAMHPSRISFEAADAEGVSAMEQRIQQLTQALSRVGRVLDRHRESSLHANSSKEPRLDDSVKNIHSPLAGLSDEKVVHWLWYHEKGVVRSFLRACSLEKCVSPTLLAALDATEKKYSDLLSESSSDGCRTATTSFAGDARMQVRVALLEFREQLFNGLHAMQVEMKSYELEIARRKAKVRRDTAKKQQEAEKEAAALVAQETVSSLLQWMVDTVATRAELGCEHPEDSKQENSKSILASPSDLAKDSFCGAADSKEGGNAPADPRRVESAEGDENKLHAFPLHVDRDIDISEDDLKLKPWLDHYADRWKLEAAADLLLFYAYTSTFFAVKPYTPLESTPIEVYARELGNSVPRSLVETAQEEKNRDADDGFLLASVKQDLGDGCTDENVFNSSALESQSAPTDSGVLTEAGIVERKSSKSKKKSRFCEPDDIITNVTISYEGDFVLSQLLQWYNGGFGQKQGLPDLLGCASLPSMSGCWHDSQGKLGRSKKAKPTRYSSELRPLLLDWLQDPRKRGSPLPEQLNGVFSESAQEPKWEDDRFQFPPMGSPVLDLLVTGDDSSIQSIAAALAEHIRSNDEKSGASSQGASETAAERLQSTMDEGMPAQAVANWVQCENPDCLKWRKLPWYADVDALPEKFYCADNQWNEQANTCEAPEDKWDENDAQLRNGGIAKDTDADMLSADYEEAGEKLADGNVDATDAIDEKTLVIGARFDVLRTGKEAFCTGMVMDKDLSGSVKRVLFHFPKTNKRFDEWVEMGSSRIAPFNSKQEMKKTKKDLHSGLPSEAATKDKTAKAIKNDTGLLLVNEKPVLVAGEPKSRQVPCEAVAGAINYVSEAEFKSSGVPDDELSARVTGAFIKMADTGVQPGASTAGEAPRLLAVDIHYTIDPKLAVAVSGKSMNTTPSLTHGRTNASSAPHGSRGASSRPGEAPGGPSSRKLVSSASQLSAGKRAAPVKSEASRGEQSTARNTAESNCAISIDSVPGGGNSSSTDQKATGSAAMRIPKKEIFHPEAMSSASVNVRASPTVPLKTSSQGGAEASIARIPRKTFTGTPSPRNSESVGNGMTTGTHQRLQFSVGMKASGSPDKAMVPPRKERFAAQHVLPRDQLGHVYQHPIWPRNGTNARSNGGTPNSKKYDNRR